MKTRNDSEIDRDCVKRANVVYMLAYVKKSSPGSTQLPTSPHLLSPSQPLYSYQRDIHLIIVCGAPRAYGLAGQQDRWSLGAPQASYERRRHRNCFQTGPVQAFPKK